MLRKPAPNKPPPCNRSWEDLDLDGIAQLLEQLLPAAVQDDSNPPLQGAARGAAWLFLLLVNGRHQHDTLMRVVPFVFYRAPAVLAAALARPAPAAGTTETAAAIVRHLAEASALLAARGAADVMPAEELLAALVAWMPALQRLTVLPGGAGKDGWGGVGWVDWRACACVCFLACSVPVLAKCVLSAPYAPAEPCSSPRPPPPQLSGPAAPAAACAVPAA